MNSVQPEQRHGTLEEFHVLAAAALDHELRPVVRRRCGRAPRCRSVAPLIARAHVVVQRIRIIAIEAT